MSAFQEYINDLNEKKKTGPSEVNFIISPCFQEEDICVYPFAHFQKASVFIIVSATC